MVYKVDDILEQMVLEGRSHFSPHYVCNRADITDLKIVTDYMFSQVGFKLRVYYEIECPVGDSDFAVGSLSDLIIEKKQCKYCGRVYTPDLDRIWVVFDFLPGYIDYVKKKKKYKSLALMPV